MNIAEILKNCPRGMKLYSPVFGEVEFESVSPDGWIKCYANSNELCIFYPDGTYSKNGEVMLFPSKKQRDWNKFQIPFKFGDIVAAYNEQYQHTHMAIFDKYIGDKFMKVICTNLANSNEIKIFGESEHWHNQGVRYATEKEKEFFFNLLKEQGYTWTNNKLLKRKFKIGDTITDGNIILTICKITEDFYIENSTYGNFETQNVVSIIDQDNWKIAKFNLCSLKPYDKVLVRTEEGAWYPSLVSWVNSSGQVYLIDSESSADYVIPFESNEHLIGTWDNPVPYYITWE